MEMLRSSEMLRRHIPCRGVEEKPAASRSSQQSSSMTRDEASQHPPTFRTTVHGTVFGSRSAHLEGIEPGDPLVLIPDPPGEEEPAVWVHMSAGDPVGHLPPEINSWLAPYLLRGGVASAVVIRVGGLEVPSWKRLVIEVRCPERRRQR